MRGIFGLVGVLVALGIVIIIMKTVELPHAQNALQAKKSATEQLDQISGRDPATGQDITTTYAVTARSRADGRIDCLQVDRVDAGGGMQTYFGLQQGDLILQTIGSHGDLHDCMEYTDTKDAEMWVREAYAGTGKLIIRRGNSFLVLPGNTPAAASLGNRGATAQPAAPIVKPTPPAVPVPPKPDPNQHKDQPTESDPLGDINRRLHPTGGM